MTFREIQERKRTIEQEAPILLQAGYSPESIAKRFDVTPGTVRRALKKVGSTKRTEPATIPATQESGDAQK